MKRCAGPCGLKRSLDDFYKDKRGKPRARCKDCMRAASRRRYRGKRDLPDELQIYPTRRVNRVRAAESKARQKRILQHREAIRRWLKENPEIYAASQAAESEREARRGPSRAKRRALHYDAFVETVDKRILYDIVGGICGICGEIVPYEKATIDHITPLSRAGRHSYANTQIAHGTCNRRKGNLMPDDFELDHIPL